MSLLGEVVCQYGIHSCGYCLNVVGGKQLLPTQGPPQVANSSNDVLPNLPHGIVGVGVGVVVDVVVGVGVTGHAALGLKAIQSPQSKYVPFIVSVPMFHVCSEYGPGKEASAVVHPVKLSDGISK